MAFKHAAYEFVLETDQLVEQLGVFNVEALFEWSGGKLHSLNLLLRNVFEVNELSGRLLLVVVKPTG